MEKPEADRALHLSPPTISAMFYGCIKLLKATAKEKKLRQGFVVTRGNQMWTILCRRPYTNFILKALFYHAASKTP